MKELSIEGKATRYDEAIERAKTLYENANGMILKKWVEQVFPELKESEDEKIRKEMLQIAKESEDSFYMVMTPNKRERLIAWLEKQVPVDEDEIVKGIRRGVAISLINHIDANSKGMCLSNMECEDIENAIVNEDWNKVYGYMKKKLEKQGEQKPDETEKGTNGNEREIPNFAWSEEDENIRQWIVSDIEKLLDLHKKASSIADKEINWLKSLKDRVGCEVNCTTTWKPSEEQIEAVKCAALDVAKFSSRSKQLRLENEPYYKALISLCQDLKKLREKKL